MLRPTCVFFLIFVANARASMEGHIVGGYYTDILHHSHSASLNINCVSNRLKATWICGSSVLNQRILVTAAHCLHECTMASHIAINLGDNNRENGLSYVSFGFVLHEDYDSITSENDVCLVKTNAALPLGNMIHRVALMRRPPYSEKATIAGWGVIDEDNLTPTLMIKYVAQKVWSRSQCLEIFGVLPRGTFCAASPDRMDEYPSQGDSGCGLLVRGYIQIGLVSYKTPSVSKNVVVYTDVGYFYDWIKVNSRRLFCFQNEILHN